MSSFRIIYLHTILLITVLCSCNIKERTNAQNDSIKPPPPPLQYQIDFQSLCDTLKKSNITTFNNSIYLIYNTNIHDRAIFEYILNEKYNLLIRPILNPLDSTCIKPIYDSIILKKYRKDCNEIIKETNNKVEAIKQDIGPYQVKTGVYYTADKFPMYLTGVRQLYQDVTLLKEKQKRKSNKTGSVMFYITIDTAGNIDNTTIFEHLDNETDSLSMLIMKQLPSKWSPAILNGHPVSFWKQYSIQW
jgi:hypothetical protein